MSRIVPLGFILCAALAACGHRSEPAPAAPPAPPPSAHPGGGGSLAERLAGEACARPPGAPHLEDLVAALDRAGIPVARRRQVLGSTVGAAYCAAAVTARGLGLALCEFASADAAAAGLARSHAEFDRLIPGRLLVVHGQGLLTITNPSGASLDEETGAATALFAAL